MANADRRAHTIVEIDAQAIPEPADMGVISRMLYRAANFVASPRTVTAETNQPSVNLWRILPQAIYRGVGEVFTEDHYEPQGNRVGTAQTTTNLPVLGETALPPVQLREEHINRARTAALRAGADTWNGANQASDVLAPSDTHLSVNVSGNLFGLNRLPYNRGRETDAVIAERMVQAATAEIATLEVRRIVGSNLTAITNGLEHFGQSQSMGRPVSRDEAIEAAFRLAHGMD